MFVRQKTTVLNAEFGDGVTRKLADLELREHWKFNSTEARELEFNEEMQRARRFGEVLTANYTKYAK